MAKTTIKFSYSGTDCIVNGPDGATDVRTLSKWVTSLSEGLRRWSYKTTDRHVEQWTLRLDSLTKSMKQALQSFFDFQAQGPTRTFSYTHTDEEVYTARFVDTDLRWTRRNDQDWSVTLTLELSGTLADGVNYAGSPTTSATTTTSTTTSGG